MVKHLQVPHNMYVALNQNFPEAKETESVKDLPSLWLQSALHAFLGVQTAW